LAVKPVAQSFADELMELVSKYKDSGLTNAECIGALAMYQFQIQYKIQKKGERNDRPY